MKYLAFEKERPGATAEDFQPYLAAEADQAWRLYTQGIVRELYFRADQHTAVLVLECSQEGEACEALNSLPLVQAGLITFELIQLMPYDGFSRLFGTERA